MGEGQKHRAHPEIANRLRRANGHLAKVIQRIEEGQSCLKVAQQLHAVPYALENAKRAFVQHHIAECLDETRFDSPEDWRKHLEEFQKITKCL